jgi:hypothetical protein
MYFFGVPAFFLIVFWRPAIGLFLLGATDFAAFPPVPLETIFRSHRTSSAVKFTTSATGGS